MPILELLALAIVLLELATRIIEFVLMIRSALQSRKGEERP